MIRRSGQIVASLFLTLVFAGTACAESAGALKDQLSIMRAPLASDNEFHQQWLEYHSKVSALLVDHNYKVLDKLCCDTLAGDQMLAAGLNRSDYLYSAFVLQGRDFKPLSDGEYQQLIAQLNEWAKQFPKSVHPTVVLATVYDRWAWKARGGGYAETVSQDGWRLMSQREGVANKFAKAAVAAPGSSARAYYLLLKMDKDNGASKEASDKLFKAAVGKFPNYRMFYFARILALQPRWGGAAGEWERFANQSADAVGGVEGDVFYAQLLWYVDKTTWYSDTGIYKLFKVDYARAKRGFEALLAAKPHSLAVISAYCHAAATAADKPTALKLFAKLNGRMDREAWDGEQDYARWRNAVI
ncbi:MAG TPA: DUF4034 domain-containing protein [Candidatus Obscuribacterales bacterium]